MKLFVRIGICTALFLALRVASYGSDLITDICAYPSHAKDGTQVSIRFLVPPEIDITLVRAIVDGQSLTCTRSSGTNQCYASWTASGTDGWKDIVIDPGDGSGTYTSSQAILKSSDPHVIHVKPTGSDSNSGLTWNAARDTIWAATASGIPGDEIWVAAGTYTNPVFTNVSGISFYGGFNGTETARDQRDWKENEAVIQGDGSSFPGIYAMDMLIPTVIDGFTIRGWHSNYYGGAIQCSGNVIISHNIIRDNYGEYAGGIWSDNGSVQITDNVFIGNTSGSGVGAIAVMQTGADPGSSAVVANNTIVGNGTLNDSFPVVYIYDYTLVANNIIAFNQPGAIYTYDASSITLSHNCIYGNASDYSGDTIPDHSTDICSDPLFVDGTNQNFHVLPASPCIDNGDDAAAQTGDVDLDLRPRQIDVPGTGRDGGDPAPVDIGAYEYPNVARPVFGNIVATPPNANKGESVTVSFSCSEALDGLPAVTVNGNSVSNLTSASNTYACTYTVPDSDPEGPAEIRIAGTAVDGSSGSVMNNNALFIIQHIGLIYDEANGCYTVTNGNGTSTVYTFDARYRLRQVKHMKGSTPILGAVVDYNLDGVGNRTEIAIGDGTTSKLTSYTYDEQDRLSSVTLPADQGNIAGYEYTYDWVGNRTNVTTIYSDGSRVSSGSNFNEVDQLVWPANIWLYSGSGSLTQGPGSDGRTRLYTYDLRELLSTVTVIGL